MMLRYILYSAKVYTLRSQSIYLSFLRVIRFKENGENPLSFSEHRSYQTDTTIFSTNSLLYNRN
jgi:hypothetical protein